MQEGHCCMANCSRHCDCRCSDPFTDFLQLSSHLHTRCPCWPTLRWSRHTVMHIHRGVLVLPEEDHAVYLVQNALQHQMSSVPCFILTCTEDLA